MSTNNTKQTAWVALGSICSFGVGLVSSMILSRYFDKADYGTYKQVMYVYNTMLIVFTLGLPKAYSYFLPRVDNNQAKDLIKKLTLLFLALGFVFSLVLYFCSGLIADILKNPDLKDALKLFAIVPTLMLPTMGLEGILSTYRKNQFLAYYTIATRLLMLLCIALPVLLFNLGYQEAIIGFVIASFISCLLALYLKYYPVKEYGNDSCPVSYHEIFRFSLPLLYASLWGAIITSTDQFFISRYFGNEAFAEFSNGMMALPFVGMVVSACATVLSPIFSRLSHEKVDFNTVVFPIWLRVYEKTAKILYPILAFCWVFAEQIMVLFYGNQYANSGIYFRFKIFISIFNLIVFAPLIINTGKVAFYSRVHLITAITIVILEYLSVKMINSPYAVIAVSTFCNLGKIFVMLNLVAHMFKVKMFNLFPMKLILKILIPSLLFLYTEYYFVDQFEFNNNLLLFICLFFYMIFFLFNSYYFKLDYTSIIKSFINK